jgi:hypothetical protein
MSRRVKAEISRVSFTTEAGKTAALACDKTLAISIMPNQIINEFSNTFLFISLIIK